MDSALSSRSQLSLSASIASSRQSSSSSSSNSTLSSTTKKRIAKLPNGLLRAAAISLNLFLVLMHIALLAIWRTGVEQNLVFQFGEETDILSIVLINVSQTVAVTYLALTLAVVQQASARKNLMTTQTLTALHDKQHAWMSLGAAASALWDQFRIRSAFVGVLAILLYLTGIAILHVTAASLFTLQGSTQNASTIVPTRLAMQNLTSVWNGNASTIFTEQSAILSIIEKFDLASSVLLQTPGLSENVIYDTTLEYADFATVNSTAFLVNCGTVEEAHLAAECNGGKTHADNETVWCMNIEPSEQNRLHGSVSFSFGLNVVGAIRTNPPLHFTNESDAASFGANMIMFTSINFTDGPGQPSVPVVLNPPMMTGIEELYVIGCSLSESNQTVVTQANVLQEPFPNPFQQYWPTWNPFSVAAANGSQMINHFWDIFTTAQTDIQAAQGSALCTSGVNSNCSQEDTNDHLTVVDEYIMNAFDLNAFPDQVALLSELENSMAALTAIMYWSTTQMYTNITDGQTLSTESGAAEATIINYVSRLNINIVPLSINLIVSTLLFLLSIYLVWVLWLRRVPSSLARSNMKASTASTKREQPRGAQAQLPNARSSGILQLLWFLWKYPAVRERLLKKFDEAALNNPDDLECPSAKELRSLGMFEVDFMENTDDDDDDDNLSLEVRLEEGGNHQDGGSDEPKRSSASETLRHAAGEKVKKMGGKVGKKAGRGLLKRALSWGLDAILP